MKIALHLTYWLLGASLLRANAQTTIAVNTNTVIASGVSHKYGINLNAGMDADENRPAGARPLAQSLQEMGAKRLRFPGGEKTNYYVWADAPYTAAATAHWVPGSYYAGASQKIMNVDQFMATCTQAGAEAQLNVAYNPAAGLDQRVAAAWVRYANVTKRYGITYWEVGNEMWNGKGLSAAQVGAIASAYAAAMKAVDPTIKVGVSWNNQAGFQTILTAAPNLDFVTCSNYTTLDYASYDTYANTANVDLLADARGALSAVGTSSKTVVVSEFNALNWTSGWTNTNDLGHALINFETVGQLLTTPKIAFGSLWNTRWFGEAGPAYTLYTALGNANQLHASGLALAVWGKFLQDQLVSSTSSGTLKTYAAYNPGTGALNIFLENKATYAQSVLVPITSATTYAAKAAVWQLKGSGASDPLPTWSPTDSVGVTANRVANLRLPAVSVTVLSLTPAGRTRAAATNWVANGGFESGSLAPWATWLNGGKVGLSTATKRMGAQAGWAGGGKAYLYQVVQGLQPNTAYTLTCEASAYSTSGAAAWVGVKNTGAGEPSQEVGDTNGNWRPVSLTFTTGSTSTTAEIYLWNSDASTWGWIDEVSLTSAGPTAASSTALLAAVRPAAAQAAVVVFPNPFQSTLSFALMDQQELPEVHLLDVFGRAIPGVQVQRSGQQGQVTAPASLRAGMYLLQLTTGAGTTTVHKVVKQ
jgi:hypothetical protein